MLRPGANRSSRSWKGPKACTASDRKRISQHLQVGAPIERAQASDEYAAALALGHLDFEEIAHELASHGRFALDRLQVVAEPQVADADGDRVETGRDAGEIARNEIHFLRE